MSKRFPPVKDPNHSARIWRTNAVLGTLGGLLVGLLFGAGICGNADKHSTEHAPTVSIGVEK